MKPATKLIAIFCLGLFLNSIAHGQEQKPQRSARGVRDAKRISPRVKYLPSAGTRPAPFSEAVRVGNMLYLSGKLGTGPSGLVSGGIKAETKQTLENIRSVLERNGSSLNEVVKCTVMLADMSEWGAMNEVYVTYFAKDRLPARSAFGVSGLALNARVEIECLATVR